MELGRLVMATHRENTEGFLALLNEVMWRANYSYRLEYAVHALGVGHGMIDYTYKIHIPSHLCHPGEETDHLAWGKGTSIDMAIQVVAYHAIAMLREAVITITEPPFQHFFGKDRDEQSFQVLYAACTQYSV